MPEGHTIHRLARLHTADLAGHQVAVDSPQGRFAEGARKLDGGVVRGVDAHGKHLFYRWDAPAGALTLHVHLGLFGAFTRHDTSVSPTPAPSPATRIRLSTRAVTIHLTGPTVTELLEPAAEDVLRARLGPDPLDRSADPEPVWAAFQRRRSPVGAVLLDQRVLVGVGNVYRAEALFLCGIHPGRPANELDRETFDTVWATLRRLLRMGARSGRIVTVVPRDVGATSRAAITGDDRLYVYRRTGQPCRRCGTPIRSWTLAARTISACPRCQPT